MSTVNIGLIAHNGVIGSKILGRLVPLHRDRKIRLVVIHRPTSSTANVPDDVEKRALDWSKPDGKEFDDAFAGLNIVISAITSERTKDQLVILPALSRSKSLQTFFPSDFDTAWTKQELDELHVPWVNAKFDVVNEAKRLGVPVTNVRIGLLTDFVFLPVLWNAKENKIFVYSQSLKNKIPFTSSDYAAAAIAELIQRPIDSLKNKTFYTVEESHTGQEVADVIAKFHGKPITQVPFDDAQIQEGMQAEDTLEALGFAILKKSGHDAWFNEGEEIRLEGEYGKGVEEEFKKAIAA